MARGSIAEMVRDWENLVANAKSSGTEVPGLEAYTGPMEQFLDRAKALSADLERRKAVKQEGGKERRVLLQRGRKQAARLRAALKAHFGIDSERLVEFGARPVRPRTRRATEEVPRTPPPAIEIKPPGQEENEAPRNPAAS
jgi:hypothetical protein